jgi:hypothetical protein
VESSHCIFLFLFLFFDPHQLWWCQLPPRDDCPPEQRPGRRRRQRRRRRGRGRGKERAARKDAEEGEPEEEKRSKRRRRRRSKGKRHTRKRGRGKRAAGVCFARDGRWANERRLRGSCWPVACVSAKGLEEGQRQARLDAQP